jgi:hypothetical protein
MSFEDFGAFFAAAENPPVQRIIESYLWDAYKIADMKKFHEDAIQDGRLSLAEFKNFTNQCVGGQPKLWYAYLHLAAAQNFPQDD